MNENLTEMIQEHEERLARPPVTPINTQQEILTFDDIELNLDPPASLKEARDLQESNVAAPLNDNSNVTQENESPFATETDLINHTRETMYKADVAILLSYWEIGRSINSFYKGKYGSNELQRIAEATGIGKDTLAKACRFAKQYDHEQVQILIQSHIPIPWNRISQNLTIPSERFIETLQKSETPDQFYNDIINLKNPGEKRGKSRLPGRVESEVIDIQPVTMVPGDEETPLPDDYPVADHQDHEEINEQYRAYEKELQTLTDEIQKLAIEGIVKDQKIEELEKKLKQALKDVDRYYDRNYALNDKIEKVIDICKKGANTRMVVQLLESDD